MSIRKTRLIHASRCYPAQKMYFLPTVVNSLSFPFFFAIHDIILLYKITHKYCDNNKNDKHLFIINTNKTKTMRLSTAEIIIPIRTALWREEWKSFSINFCRCAWKGLNYDLFLRLFVLGEYILMFTDHKYQGRMQIYSSRVR